MYFLTKSFFQQDRGVDFFCAFSRHAWSTGPKEKKYIGNDGSFCVVLIRVLTWSSFRKCHMSESHQ